MEIIVTQVKKALATLSKDSRRYRKVKGLMGMDCKGELKV
jgi:hypothetical protein